MNAGPAVRPAEACREACAIGREGEHPAAERGSGQIVARGQFVAHSDDGAGSRRRAPGGPECKRRKESESGGGDGGEGRARGGLGCRGRIRFEGKREVVLKIASGLEALVGILGEAAADDAIERRREVERLRFAVKDGADHGCGGAGCEGAIAAEHFVEDAAEGEQIGTGVDGPVLQLLGGHVLCRVPTIWLSPVSAAVTVLSPLLRSGPPCLASPKSSSLMPCFVSRMLAGLRSRCTMPFFCGRRREASRDLTGAGDGFGDRQRAFHWFAVDQLHDEIIGPDVVELADIRVVEGGNGASFAFEAFGESFGHDFDGDGAIETGVAGFVHLAHAAGADERDDFVRSQTGSRVEHRRLTILPLENKIGRLVYRAARSSRKMRRASR